MLIHADFQDNKKKSIYNRFRTITKKLNKQQNVEFALYCAKDVFHLNNNQKKISELCISLVEKWLKDNYSVTQEEIRNAANAVWADGAAWASSSAALSAANAAWTAANAAAVAVDAVWTADAHAAARSAARSAAWANAAWAARAANAAANAAVHVHVREHKILEYLIIINSFFSTTNITQPFLHLDQKIIYLIDELDENLIIQQDNLYFLNMNNIQQEPHLGCKSQYELIQKILHSEETYFWFARCWINRLYP